SGAKKLNRLADTRRDENCTKAAERIKIAYNQALEDGQKTRDLGGELNTEGFVQAIIERMQA
ncbi:MAG: isocitrate/isopropylmalate dehydrogenase family protein, partial [Polyangiaceae bacterium]